MNRKWQFSLGYLLLVVFWIALALSMMRFLVPFGMPSTLIGLLPSVDPTLFAPFSLVLITLAIVGSTTTAGMGIGYSSRAIKVGAILGASIGSAIAAVAVVLLLFCVFLESGWPF
jgi:ABC-type anion transport system duplicated permease subunit